MENEADTGGDAAEADTLQSRVIHALRFPLIVGVLLIHTRVRPPAGDDGFFFYFEALFSRILGHAAVPLFFFISGYLFFRAKRHSGGGGGGQKALKEGTTKNHRIDRLLASPDIEFTGDEYRGKYELTRDSARLYALKNLRGRLTNEDSGDVIFIEKRGLKKVTSHGANDETHLKSIAFIPELIRKAIFVEEVCQDKSEAEFASYRYYVAGLKIAGIHHTAKIVVGIRDGRKFYDHSLVRCEKKRLVDSLNQSASGGFKTKGGPSFADTLKDVRLARLLKREKPEEPERDARQRGGGAGRGAPFAPFTVGIWLAKLRRRARTLLLPYVLWISGWAALYTLLVKTGIIGASRPLDASFYLHAFWDIEADADGTRPLVGQFWFLRDLMCVAVLAPVLRFALARRAGVSLAFLAALGALWFLDAPPQSPLATRIPALGDRGLSHWVLFFFAAGAWFSIHGKNFLTTFRRARLPVLAIYPALVLADLATLRFADWNFAVHRLGILAALPFLTLLAARLLPARSKPENVPRRAAAAAAPAILHKSHARDSLRGTRLLPAAAFLSAASFFVYAAHGPALLFFLERFILKPLAPQTDAALTACYLGALLGELVLCLALYALLRRLFPRLLSLLIGGPR